MTANTMNTKTVIRSKSQLRTLQNRRGAAVVELAVVLPVFVFLLLGTIETCTMIFLQQSLEIAAYEATRTAIVSGSSIEEIEAAANRILNSRKVTGATIVVSPGNHEAQPYGTFLRVNVSAPCNLNSIANIGIYGSKQLTGSVEMMKEFD